MSKSLLLFTIGPVQPFIAQSRKTRDLWVGSLLLSKLMEAAMEQFVIEGQDEPSPRLIFPAHPKTSDKIPDLPNKFVAIVEDEQEATYVAGEAVRLLRKRWETIAARVWDHLAGRTAIKRAQDIWDRQVAFESFFEVYWAIAPAQPGEQETEPYYGKWYARAQQALDARKRLRDFQQQEEVERGEKSTISGERQALHGGAGDLQSIKAFWKDIARKFSEAQISHDGSERLDAIDTIKRFATEAKPYIPDLPFPSTSTVAAAPFIAELLEKAPASETLSEALKKWEEFTDVGRLANGANPRALPYLRHKAEEQGKEWLKLLERDGDCFFPETYTLERLEENYGFPNPNSSKRTKDRRLSEEEQRQEEKRLEQARELIRQAPGVLGVLRRAAAEAKIQPLSPYYAVLSMDGDHMGTLLSQVESEEEHRGISGALSTFARSEAPPKVERRFPAKLVYAGGDDVLAVAPMRSALDLGQQLQEAYVDAMKASTEKLRKRDEEPAKKEGRQPLEVTMSAGIVIAHYLDPLSHVLREARRAEEAAKERYGRNAVVVTLLRRSGEPTTVGCKWRYSEITEENDQPLRLFEEITDYLKEDVLSSRFVYNLAEEAATLSTLSEPVQKSEIKRLLLRGTDNKKLASLDEERQQQWANLPARLARLAEEMNPREENGTKTKKAVQENKPDEVELWRDGPRRGLVEISGWLLLMAFTLRGGTV